MLKIKSNLKIILFAVLSFGILGTAKDSQAATKTVTSCTVANVQAAVDASVAGDTVYLNCSSAAWSAPVIVTKGITIMGNGPSATTLTANNSCLFSVTLGSGADFRIHDLGIAGSGGSCGGLETQFIRLSGTGYSPQWGTSGTIWNSLRADHLKFTNTNEHAFTIDPWWNIPSSPKALFDHITFTSNQWSRLLKIAGSNLSWKDPDNYGTSNAVFIEDSTFNWTGGATGELLDTEHGTRLVVRHNTITNGDIQMHDTGSTPAARGQRVTEIYNNTISCPDGSNCQNMPAMGLRGGGFIVYNNTITGNFFAATWPQIWRNEIGSGYLGGKCNGTALRACNTETLMHCSAGSHQVCSGDYDCPSGTCVITCSSNSDCPVGVDGTATCLSNVDQVNGGSDSSGYPCRDQTGWGQEYGAGGRNQYPSPVYWWNNGSNTACATGGSCPNPVAPNDVAKYFLLNRDYCLHNPSTACGSKSDWSYIPYAYPHPLQGGDDNTAPMAPTGLTVN